jgi:CheY-like chemotaxis protein
MYDSKKWADSGEWAYEPFNVIKKNDERPTEQMPYSMKNARILIVDDDAGIRDMLLSAISFLDLEAVAARDGVEALNLLLKSRFELVVTDLQMPRMDGWRLASCIKRVFPETPIIMMTAQARWDLTNDLKKDGFDSVLFKPFKLEQLQQAIWGILDIIPRETLTKKKK